MSELINARFIIEYDDGDYVLSWSCIVDQETHRIESFDEQDNGVAFSELPDYVMETGTFIDFGRYEATAIKDSEYNDDPERIEEEFDGETFYLFDDEEIPVS